ncbi:MAG: hypothetical protein L6R30_18515 [Thermoanaerobaculia bacterium]|nr:hypothetical protein [Thermoanaerobaculia bacterium]
MPRRFAIVLLSVLLFLLIGLVLVRWLDRRQEEVKGMEGAIRRPLPPPEPPAEIPERRFLLYFESPDDARLHPEARDLRVVPDDLATIRAVVSAVLEGPYDPKLLRPFPEGWKLRSVFRLREGLVILDLSPPVSEKPTPPPGSLEPEIRQAWQAGTHEEWIAVQSLLVTVVRNVEGAERFVLLIGGEPAETLAGHIDLSHPLKPDPSTAADDPPPTPPATPSPVPTSTPVPTGTAGAGPSPAQTASVRTPKPSPEPTRSPVPSRTPGPPRPSPTRSEVPKATSPLAAVPSPVD